jgi:formylglycine-generating enzyme required for sulfatase activity
MSDIFLSYASEDRQRVAPLVRALERHGWSVWWDRTILPGRTYDIVIEEALEAARCVIVVWSEAFVVSPWVFTEAEEGRQRDILIPVLFDEVRPPFGFRHIQAARLLDWQETAVHDEFDTLVQAIQARIGPPAQREPVATGAGTAPLPQRQAPARGQESSPPAGTVEVHIVNSLSMPFVLIPAGEFLMGSADGDDDDRPVHTVRISQPFYLGQYAVTQAQWQAVMESNPSRFTGDPNRPVENVSWEEVQEFIRRLHAREGGPAYRLPTEAEWEYAARAGSTTAYCFGDDPRQLREYAWHSENSGGQTHPVGQLKPSAWGLYDMHGNVWEWVQDWYGPYPADAAVDPAGPSSGSRRVNRGGSWSCGASRCRSAYRNYWLPGLRNGYLGCRLLRLVP